MPITIDTDTCVKCGTCVDTCPASALTEVTAEGPVYVEDNCVSCYACVEACPVNAIAQSD